MHTFKTLTVAACAAALFIFSQARADLVTIDFNELSGNVVVDDEYASLGALFHAHYYVPDFPDPLTIEAPGYTGYYGLDGVVLNSYCNTSAYIQVDFSIAVDFVSVDMLPFESGDYQLGLELYDAANTIIVSTTKNLTSSGSIWNGGIDPAEMITLSGKTPAADVAYARFYGFNTGMVNAVTFDNVTFGTANVPEPSLLPLLSVSLLAIGFLKRR